MHRSTLLLLIGAHTAGAYTLLPSLSSVHSVTTRGAGHRAAGQAAALPAPVRAAVSLQAPDLSPIKSDETYNIMLSTLMKTNESITAQISANYAMVDMGFLERLEKAFTEATPDEMSRLGEIKDAISSEMASRMQSAAEGLRDILQSPTPVVMEGKIAGLARQGRIDDALLQMLQANLEQARAAGEQGKAAVSVLSKLQERVQTELDAKLEPQVVLIRRLMRMEDKDARLSLLRDKMSPKGGSSVLLIGEGGQEQEPEKDEPEVSPRLVAEAITEIKARFGNVDEYYDTGFVAKLTMIADEAEAVALDLAGGKELTAQQQQDLMWDKGSVSVWDLEQIEEEAHEQGNWAVWESEAQEQMARQDSAMRKSSIDADWGQ
jgi:hypothetical protein